MLSRRRTDKAPPSLTLLLSAVHDCPGLDGLLDHDGVGHGDGEGDGHDQEVHRVEPVAAVEEHTRLQGESAEDDLNNEVARDGLKKNGGEGGKTQ